MSETTYKRDNLIAGKVKSQNLFVASGQGTVVRGQVMKKNAGKLEKITLATDTPSYIILSAGNATAADAEVVCSNWGEFYAGGLKFDDGDTLTIDNFRTDFPSAIQIKE